MLALQPFYSTAGSPPPHTHTLAQTEEGHGLHGTPFPILPRSATGLGAHISPITNSCRSTHSNPPNCRVLSHPEKSSYLNFKIHDLSCAESAQLPISLCSTITNSPRSPFAACCFLECWPSFLTHGLLFSTHED